MKENDGEDRDEKNYGGNKEQELQMNVKRGNAEEQITEIRDNCHEMKIQRKWEYQARRQSE